MAQFTYNNTKIASISYTSFNLNYGYHLWIFYKEDIDPCSKFKSANELLAKLQELITICRKNLYYAQEFQKQVYHKDVKPKSYAPGEKSLVE